MEVSPPDHERNIDNPLYGTSEGQTLAAVAGTYVQSEEKFDNPLYNELSNGLKESMEESESDHTYSSIREMNRL